MVLVFIFLGIIITILILFLILIFSTIQIEIKNFNIASKNIKLKNRIENKYKIKITLRFLGKIPILFVNLNSLKIKKMYKNNKLKNVDFKSIQNKVDKKDIFKAVKKIKITVANLKLKIDLGTEEAVLTSYIVAILASIIGIILSKFTTKNINYIINPLYENKNEYYMSLDGIIQIKIVHIIDSMLFLIKKGMKKNERSSNRRSYAYRYE